MLIKVVFNVSNESINDSLIGNLIFRPEIYEFTDNLIEKTFTQSEIEVIDSYKPLDMCRLPNEFIISANYDYNSISIYDKTLNYIKSIHDINGSPIKPAGLATNNVHRIYISDQHNNTVIMTDLEFNKLKCLNDNKNCSVELDKPFGICYESNMILVCDHGNKQIQILSENLVFLNSITLDYKPWSIKAINNTFAVISESPTGKIFFYDLNNFSLKYSYDHGFGQVSLVGSYFCEVVASRNFYLYDLEGKLIKVIDLNRFGRYIDYSGYNGAIVSTRTFFLILSFCSGKILKLEIHE